MKKLFVTLMFGLFSVGAFAQAQDFAPLPGHYTPDGFFGSGVYVSIQNNTMVVTVLSYKDGGSWWVQASGAWNKTAKTFTQSAIEYRTQPNPYCTYLRQGLFMCQTYMVDIVWQSENTALLYAPWMKVDGPVVLRYFRFG